MRTVSRLIGLGCLLLTALVANCDEGMTNGTTDMSQPAPDLSTALGLSAISPMGGTNAGGTSITLTGSNFQAGATVTVGGAPCQNVMVQSPTTLTCTTPAKAGTCGPTDVVVQNPGGQSVTRSDLFAYTSASLSFSAMNTVSTGGSPRHVTLDDWNGDGKVDVVVGLIGGAGQLNIHNGDGKGGFLAGNGVNSGSQPRDILSKDLNGDGKPDLIVANELSNTITFHLNNGNGFAAPTSISTPMGPQGLALADA